VLGEVVSGDETMKERNVGLEAIEGLLVKSLDRCILDRSVHALGLTIGPRVVGPGKTMLDLMFRDRHDRTSGHGGEQLARCGSSANRRTERRCLSARCGCGRGTQPPHS
jgi:hypothetical protein